MDIGGWLRSLGLERYEAAFRENEIDDTVLPTLTASLKKTRNRWRIWTLRLGWMTGLEPATSGATDRRSNL